MRARHRRPKSAGRNLKLTWQIWTRITNCEGDSPGKAICNPPPGDTLQKSFRTKDTKSDTAFRDEVEAIKGPTQPDDEAILTEKDAIAGNQKAGDSVMGVPQASVHAAKSIAEIRFKRPGASATAYATNVGKQAKPG